MTSPGLTDFLLARIADDEAVAKLARPDDHLDTRDHSFLVVEKARGYAHVAATSGRVLAKCAADRAVVVTYQSFVQASETATDLGPKLTAAGAVAALEVVLKYLALPYADHPDYDESWRP